MVRNIDTFFINGESFINYCSDNDFNYTIYIGQKCKVLRNGNCADVEEIFSEEEFGTIN